MNREKQWLARYRDLLRGSRFHLSMRELFLPSIDDDNDGRLGTFYFLGLRAKK
jgi:hypothetical protein